MWLVDTWKLKREPIDTIDKTTGYGHERHLTASLFFSSAFFCAYLGSAIANLMSTVRFFSLFYLSAHNKHKFLTVAFHPQFGLPAFTWPFCLSALTFLLLTTETNKIFKLPLAKVTYPEKNLGFFWKLKKQEKMEKTKKEKEEREEQKNAIEEEIIQNEKEQLRLELERSEEQRAASEASEGRTEETRVEGFGPGEGPQGAEDLRHGDLTEVTVSEAV